MKNFYHVTRLCFLDNILTRGLIPQIGDLSKKANETVKRIYLFDSKDALENAMLNWLGEEFEDEDVCYLEINLPNNFPIKRDGFECFSLAVIPPKYIKRINK